MGAQTRRRIVVAVGTDSHPFDRLVRWADMWALDHPHDDILIQYGTAHAPRWAKGRSILPHAELLAAFSLCDVAIVSCGPGAVMDARSMGARPVVVPRRVDLGEIVDDHQTVFSRHLEQSGLAIEVTTESQLRSVLDESDMYELRLGSSEARRPADGSGRTRIPALVNRLVWTS